MAEAKDVRQAARNMLGDRVTAVQLDTLFDEVLAITKKAWVSCPSCKKQCQVDVPDAKAVVGALADLVTKIADLPKEQESGERIVFERVIYMSPDEEQE